MELITRGSDKFNYDTNIILSLGANFNWPLYQPRCEKRVYKEMILKFLKSFIIMEFEIKDLRLIKYFLRIEVAWNCHITKKIYP